MSRAPRDAERSIGGLVASLLASGALTPEWEPALRAVDRSLFLPDVIWPLDPATGRHLTVDRRTDPRAWSRWAATDTAITTQWDDGAGSAPGGVPTSSSSMPSLVATMLRHVDARPGMRVLEIGTGTGWSSGLLAHRLGGDAVTTVEVDPVLARQARDRLAAADLHPHVIEGDGAEGCPPRSPFDRVVATAGVRTIPTAWIRQTCGGGVILAPWGTDYTSQDALVRLTVAEDGTASGPFLTPATFMKLRTHRLKWPDHDDYVPEWPGGADASTTSVPASAIHSGDPFDTAAFVLGLAVPACAHVAHEEGSGVVTAWWYGLDDRSWAAARWTPGEDTGEVYQSGARRIWDEVEAAWRWWAEEAGRPGVDRFGLTATADGRQRVWIDTPDTPVGSQRGRGRPAQALG